MPKFHLALQHMYANKKRSDGSIVPPIDNPAHNKALAKFLQFIWSKQQYANSASLTNNAFKAVEILIDPNQFTPFVEGSTFSKDLYYGTTITTAINYVFSYNPHLRKLHSSNNAFHYWKDRQEANKNKQKDSSSLSSSDAKSKMLCQSKNIPAHNSPKVDTPTVIHGISHRLIDTDNNPPIIEQESFVITKKRQAPDTPFENEPIAKRTLFHFDENIYRELLAINPATYSDVISTMGELGTKKIEYMRLEYINSPHLPVTLQEFNDLKKLNIRDKLAQIKNTPRGLNTFISNEVLYFWSKLARHIYYSDQPLFQYQIFSLLISFDQYNLHLNDLEKQSFIDCLKLLVGCQLYEPGFLKQETLHLYKSGRFVINIGPHQMLVVNLAKTLRFILSFYLYRLQFTNTMIRVLTRINKDYRVSFYNYIDNHIANLDNGPKSVQDIALDNSTRNSPLLVSLTPNKSSLITHKVANNQNKTKKTVRFDDSVEVTNNTPMRRNSNFRIEPMKYHFRDGVSPLNNEYHTKRLGFLLDYIQYKKGETERTDLLIKQYAYEAISILNDPNEHVFIEGLPYYYGITFKKALNYVKSYHTDLLYDLDQEEYNSYKEDQMIKAKENQLVNEDIPTDVKDGDITDNEYSIQEEENEENTVEDVSMTEEDDDNDKYVENGSDQSSSNETAEMSHPTSLVYNSNTKYVVKNTNESTDVITSITTLEQEPSLSNSFNQPLDKSFQNGSIKPQSEKKLNDEKVWFAYKSREDFILVSENQQIYRVLETHATDSEVSSCLIHNSILSELLYVRLMNNQHDDHLLLNISQQVDMTKLHAIDPMAKIVKYRIILH